MPIRHIGYACINQTLRGKGKNQIYTSRGLTLKSFTFEKAGNLALQNCIDLITILKWNLANNILFFRVSSEMFPFCTHPEIGYNISSLHTYEQVKAALKEAGDFAKLHSMRLNCHPGPTTIIASPHKHVVDNAVKDIQMHYEIGKLLDTDNYTINFHVGGPYNDKIGTAKRYCEAYNALDEDVRKYITVENDDKISGYTVKELYDLIYVNCGVKIVYDHHHHNLNNNNTSAIEAANLAFETWNDTIPDIHWSEPRDGQNDRAHADYINNQMTDLSDRVYDVMFEAKQKELSVLNYRKLHG